MWFEFNVAALLSKRKLHFARTRVIRDLQLRAHRENLRCTLREHVWFEHKFMRLPQKERVALCANTCDSRIYRFCAGNCCSCTLREHVWFETAKIHWLFVKSVALCANTCDSSSLSTAQAANSRCTLCEHVWFERLNGLLGVSRSCTLCEHVWFEKCFSRCIFGRNGCTLCEHVWFEILLFDGDSLKKLHFARTRVIRVWWLAWFEQSRRLHFARTRVIRGLRKRLF